MMGAYAQSDFDTLYRDSYNNLLRLAYRSTKDYHESEDLVDEAFVIYLQKSEIVHINNPRAYLVKIMSNLICNYLRLKMHDNVPLSNALENELGVDGLKRSLADALPKELQLWEREILLMRFEDQLSYAEIAERLHIKEVSCRSRLVRAKRTLLNSGKKKKYYDEGNVLPRYRHISNKEVSKC